MKLSASMKRNLLRALDREPEPLRRVHFGQAEALERRGLVTVSFSPHTHPIDKYLGGADIRLTAAGRDAARSLGEPR